VAADFSIFWKMLGRLLVHLLANKAHGEIVIIIADGTVQRVRVNQSFMPADIPKV
jgi:hypothetical protein